MRAELKLDNRDIWGAAPARGRVLHLNQLELFGERPSYNGRRPVDDPGTTYIRRAIYSPQRPAADAIRASTILCLIVGGPL